MNEDEERKLKTERDSFVKTCVIALGANYWALNRSVPQHDIVTGATRMAILLWDEFQSFRAGKYD